ncbi:tRNA preQ1(34) S-adenosylmethionine ribosyltransferase-isomerase QueA [Candidatus Peregrinibacteria bacterium]|nr:tRNA preQ1(34) S-adenosylmethionine ribosyltransferase-isomerase QueA [Candidatus Peregrinibacteria bacterium]
MKLSDFDYHLPREFIAQRPLVVRDESRLMVLNRSGYSIAHRRFFELPELLNPDSILVFNESRVIPARLVFKLGNGKGEILLIKPAGGESWECLVRPGEKLQAKATVQVDPELTFHIKRVLENGVRVIQFDCANFNAYLKRHGHTPTPPYIKEEVKDPQRYQTIYAKTEGSVAAPTAGFHFTEDVFAGLKAKGISTEFITLHVGLGTFQPVKAENIEEHKMHSEWFSLSPDVAARLNRAKQEGKKIVAVGTTSVRVLESCAGAKGILHPKSGETGIFIYPGYKWNFVDEIITNFHVPKSTLIMLVSAFAGREFVLEAYETAKRENYRFFSFGDSMWIA